MFCACGPPGSRIDAYFDSAVGGAVCQDEFEPSRCAAVHFPLVREDFWCVTPCVLINSETWLNHFRLISHWRLRFVGNLRDCLCTGNLKAILSSSRSDTERPAGILLLHRVSGGRSMAQAPCRYIMVRESHISQIQHT